MSSFSLVALVMHSQNFKSHSLNSLFESFIFCKPSKHRRKKVFVMKREDETTPRLPLCRMTFLLLFLFIFFNVGHSKHVSFSSYFIELCPVPWGREGHSAPCRFSKHSVTGQLSHASEVVNEHRHTVCTHQVVGVSGEGFVLPRFGITRRRVGGF